MAVIALSACLYSCAEKEGVVPKEEFVVPEGMTGLTLRIPNYGGGMAEFGTRAFDPREEGYMSNLYVVAIKCANVDDYGNIKANVNGSGDYVGETPDEGVYYVEAVLKYDEGNSRWDVVRTADDYTLKTGVDPMDYLIPDAERRLFTYSLNSVGEDFQLVNTETSEDYHEFNMALYPGMYRFGVIANADLYTWRANKITDFKNETDLRNLVLYFSEDTPLTPMHLPMVCNPEEIKYSIEIEGTSDNNGNSHFTDKTLVDQTFNSMVPICKKLSTRVYATMKFMVSKVRYTILFDKEEGGISEAFGSSWIRFNVDDTQKPYATNIRRYTRLFYDGDAEVKGEGGADALLIKNGEGKEGKWTMSIDRYKWSDEGDDYPLFPTSELTLWDQGTDAWIKSKKKVWQGIVYLPENRETDAGDEVLKRTVLNFPYHTRVNDLDETPELQSDEPKRIVLFGNPLETSYEGVDDEGYIHQESGTTFTLERNYFYDVVAKVVNPETKDLIIKVFVSILPWHETDQTITNEGDLFNENKTSTNSSVTNGNMTMNPWDLTGGSDTW